MSFGNTEFNDVARHPLRQCHAQLENKIPRCEGDPGTQVVPFGFRAPEMLVSCHGPNIFVLAGKRSQSLERRMRLNGPGSRVLLGLSLKLWCLSRSSLVLRDLLAEGSRCYRFSGHDGKDGGGVLWRNPHSV